MLYKRVPEVQKRVGKIYKTDNPEKAIDILTDFAQETAVEWCEEYLDLGDRLLSENWTVPTLVKDTPDWWEEFIKQSMEEVEAGSK